MEETFLYSTYKIPWTRNIKQTQEEPERWKKETRAASNLRNEEMVISEGFLFAAYTPDLEMMRLVTQKCQLVQSKKIPPKPILCSQKTRKSWLSKRKIGGGGRGRQ